MAEETTTELPSNRGRWGADDGLGTLNLITDEVRQRAVLEARSGRVVSLARPVRATSMIAGPGAPVDGSPAVYQAMMFTGSPATAMAELLVTVTHRPELTHIDALSHGVEDDLVYPGVPLADRVSAVGATLGSSSMFSDGIVTRAVFLDLAPGGRVPVDHDITASDLDAALTRAGEQLHAGDAIVVRGGWDLADLPAGAVPGMSLDALRWMHRHDVSLYLGDIADARPPIEPSLPSVMHRVGITYLGMPLVDCVEPAALAATCSELQRYSFLLVVAPQRLDGVTGLPVNPLAIF